MDLAAQKSISKRRTDIQTALRSCRLCPHDCGIDRMEGNAGFCGVDSKAHCFREMVHNGEEAELVPSHQVYFAGCNLKCGYCSVAEWNVCPGDTDGIETNKLAEIIADRRLNGAKTLNFLGGEPSVNIYGILELLELIETPTAVVWNSNMYYRQIVGDMLIGLADVFLADFKCWDHDCCVKVLGVTDYSEIAKTNIKRACEHSDVILRHLVLPGHFQCCCKPILEWIAAEIPTVKVSLRFDYIPPIPAEKCPAGYLDEQGKLMVLDTAKQLNLNLI